MSKKEVLGVLLVGMLNLFAYDLGARELKGFVGLYNNVSCKLNPGVKEKEREIKVTLAVDSELIKEYGTEVFNTLEQVIANVSQKSNENFGISFEIKDKFVYDAQERIFGYERLREASMEVPKLGNELRVVYTNRAIKYNKISDIITLGMAPINHNICLIYFESNLDDLTNLTLHEILHSFGAEHVDDSSSVMYPLMNQGGSSIDKTTLETVLYYKNKKF